MAIIGPSTLAKMRQRLASLRGVTVNYTKTDVNNAFQALEDQWTLQSRADMAAAIETAAPGKFSSAQKIDLGAVWMELKIKTGL